MSSSLRHTIAVQRFAFTLNDGANIIVHRPGDREQALQGYQDTVMVIPNGDGIQHLESISKGYSVIRQ